MPQRNSVIIILKHVLALIVGGVIINCHQAQNEGGSMAVSVLPKLQPDAIVYQGEYPGWPWVAATRSGSLLCVWREGTIHLFSPSGRIMLSKSMDEGRT